MPKPQLLGESDRERLLTYIGREPEVNLFISGDIEQFGMTDPVRAYALVNPDDSWDSIVLSFYGNYVVYSQNALYDAERMAELIRELSGGCPAGSINGKLEVVAPLSVYFREFDLKSHYIARALKVDEDAVAPLEDGFELRRLTAADYDALFGLLAAMPEYHALYASTASREAAKAQRAANEEKGCHSWGIFQGGELVATASTSAASHEAAMVVGVGTREDLRGEGLATALVARLCEDCFSAGMRFVCVFYATPEAGHMYKRIGFRNLGSYALLR